MSKVGATAEVPGAAVPRQIGPRFQRRQMRERAQRYLRGFLQHLDCLHGWQVAQAQDAARAQGMQRLLTAAAWAPDLLRDDLRASVLEQVDDALRAASLNLACSKSKVARRHPLGHATGPCLVGRAAAFGPWQTVYQRYRRWWQQGICSQTPCLLHPNALADPFLS